MIYDNYETYINPGQWEQYNGGRIGFTSYKICSLIFHKLLEKKMGFVILSKDFSYLIYFKWFLLKYVWSTYDKRETYVNLVPPLAICTCIRFSKVFQCNNIGKIYRYRCFLEKRIFNVYCFPRWLKYSYICSNTGNFVYLKCIFGRQYLYN